MGGGKLGLAEKNDCHRAERGPVRHDTTEQDRARPESSDVYPDDPGDRIAV